MANNTDNIKLEYQDLLYFGYDFADEAEGNRKAQSDFIKQVKEKFSNVKLRDAYDNIKGYRQEVWLEAKDKDNYFAWVIGKQWEWASFSMQMLKLSTGKPEQKAKYLKYLKLAIQQYPKTFKDGALKSIEALEQER